MIRRMLKEEWRMHSTVYRGRSFATFPLVVFAFSLGFSFLVKEYSTLALADIGTGLNALGAFLGLAVGSIGFSSRDAMRNVLGPMNLLVYSSRTLPVPEKKLLFDFFVKDVIYYTTLFLLPLALPPVLLSGGATISVFFTMFAWFFLALFASILIARSTLKLPANDLLNYQKLSLLSPLADKSVLDISRSSGGFIKLVFSLAVLTGFYWFTVLYFPIADKFLSNPLLSFSVMLGTLNLSIYNWLNRFDSPEDYAYLPVTSGTVLDAKKSAYLAVSLPLTVAVVLASYLFSPSDLLLSLVSAVTTTVFTLLAAVKFTGLDPNERLFDSTVFLRFVLASVALVVPLLVFSIYYTPEFFLHYLATCLMITSGSLYLLR